MSHKSPQPIYKEEDHNFMHELSTPHLYKIESHYKAEEYRKEYSEKFDTLGYNIEKDKLTEEIETLFKEAINNHTNVINNTDVAEKVFQFFYDRGAVEVRPGVLYT